MKKLTLSALAVALVLLTGCPRETVDRCTGDDPHPECNNNVPGDAGNNTTSDAGDMANNAPGDMADMNVPPDLGPCGMACADPTPICDADSGACVACIGDDDCANGVCGDDNLCVQCRGDADCTDQVCDAGTNTCVDCVDNTDCTDPTASLCDTTSNTCTACNTAADCSHLPDTTVCDASGAQGICVECTGSEYASCGGMVCDSRLRTCADAQPGQAALCEPCVSDANCRAGMLCVAQVFEATEVGTFCLWQRDAVGAGAPDGSCINVLPHVETEEQTSLDGVTAQVCAPAVTTCPALDDYRSASCTIGSDDDCGAVGFSDGLCRDEGGGQLCTIPCGGDNDCPSTFACTGSFFCELPN